MAVTLRDYQINGITQIENAWNDCRSVLFQMPTGTGKTTLFCEIARKFTTELYPDKKVLIITHRTELVQQAFYRLVSGFFLPSGIISASFIGIPSAPIQVASIQTLIRRPEHQKDIFSLVIIDEAHHALASTYKKLWDFYPSSKFLGVTATPIRTNGDGFKDLFDKLIIADSIKWFVKNNHLSDTRYFASHTPDISNVKVKAGDYDETELSEIMQDNRVMADLVQSYIDFAPNKKMIVFAVNRAHCTKIVEKFNSSGFPTKSIDTYTPAEDRQAIVSDFKNNKFKILCNVNIFTEGFDCPDVDAVQLARPTKSLTLFLQQVGRCMRPHENKQHGIILDNAGLWKEHGLPKMDRNWSLDGTDANICPSKNDIIGIKENTQRENNEPRESKGIRLVEIGELDNMVPLKAITYHSIEKSLIDKKIDTMRERMEYLIEELRNLEEDKSKVKSAGAKHLLDHEIELVQKELFELQKDLQPKRFAQVMDLIIEKCQEMIDGNDIFIDGDKEIFLEKFVEPYLKADNTNVKRETSSSSSDNFKVAQEDSVFGDAQTEVNSERAKPTGLKATFPNGLIINENKAKDTFMKIFQEFIREFGLDKLVEITKGTSLIIRDNDLKYDLINKYAKIPGTSFSLCTNNSSLVKKKEIEKIAKKLGKEISVEIIEKQ